VAHKRDTCRTVPGTEWAYRHKAGRPGIQLFAFRPYDLGKSPTRCRTDRVQQSARHPATILGDDSASCFTALVFCSPRKLARESNRRQLVARQLLANALGPYVGIEL
jgi:hypothetical protein